MKLLPVLLACLLPMPLWAEPQALLLENAVEAPSSEAVPAMQRVDYQCAAHRLLSVEYPQPEVADVLPIRILWQGQHYRLVRVSSASGVRYASQQLVWWNKGEQAVLLTRGGRTLARDCQPLASPLIPAAPTPSAP